MKIFRSIERDAKQTYVVFWGLSDNKKVHEWLFHDWNNPTDSIKELESHFGIDLF